MTPRQRRLYEYISTVLDHHPDAKYTFLNGMWYVRDNERELSYGQKTAYEAWQNAAHWIESRGGK